ncbi:MAG: hypothetical protein P4K78_10720 [Terracidiphilus sp.]|nr:hypothetical protein [Terracidiphilus sp.]
MAKYEVRRTPSQAFGSSNPLIFTIDPVQNGKCTQLDVVLQGTVTISGSTASGVVVGEGGPANLLKSLKIKLNAATGRYPSGHCVDVTARGVFRPSILKIKKLLIDQNGSTLGNGVNGTYAIYVSYPIYFTHPRSSSLSTALNIDPMAYRSIVVKVYEGLLTDCFAGNNGTLTSNLNVWVRTKVHRTPGDSFVKFIEDHQASIPATKTDFVDQGMPSGGNFLRWLLLTETTAENALTDEILNYAHVYGAGVAFENQTAADLRDMLYRDNHVDLSQSVTGMYLFDFCDGDPTNAVPAQSIRAKFDVNLLTTSYNDNLHFVTERIYVPQNFNATQMAEYGS